VPEINLDAGTRDALRGLCDCVFVHENAATFSFGPLNDQASFIIRGGSVPRTDAPGSVPTPAIASWAGSAADGGRLAFHLNLDTGEIDLELTGSVAKPPFRSIVQLVQSTASPAPSWRFNIPGPDGGHPLYQLSIIEVPRPAKQGIAGANGWFVPSWVADVQSHADQLDGDLSRVAVQIQSMRDEADYQTACQEILRARYFAARPILTDDVAAGRHDHRGADRPSRWRFRPWRRIADWWTGYSVDRAWTALHTASQALLMIQDEDEVKSELSDMKANVVHELSAGDLRFRVFLDKLNLLSSPGRHISSRDRKDLRKIREVCDSSGEAGHVDARSFRNHLILIGAFLTVVLTAVAVVGVADKAFGALLAVASASSPNRWLVLEIELVASLSGLTAAVFSLKSYTGFRWTYGLPFVQAVVKGAAGAATGLFGVFLVRSGIVTSLKITNNVEIFTVAIIFGYAQYLFTRLIDNKANEVLQSASSRNDPGAAPQLSADGIEPSIVAGAPGRPQVTGVSPGQGRQGGRVRLTGSGFKGATEVAFGEIVAIGVTIESDASITAASPPGKDTVDVTVTTPGGVSAKNASAKFRYLNGN
jgi:hypothetical protein